VTTPEDPLQTVAETMLKGCLGTAPPYHSGCMKSCHRFDHDALTAALAAPPVEVGEVEALIDATCSCKDCEKRTTETYDLPGRCLNCGTTFTVRSRKGDKPPLHVECPACQVREFSWRAALRSTAPALDVERLAEAMAACHGVNWPKRWVSNESHDFSWVARQVAAKYAALEGAQGGD
jgi:hypothetical protein